MLECGVGDISPHPNLVDDPDLPRAQGAQDTGGKPSSQVGGRESLSLYLQTMTSICLGAGGT